MTVMKNLFKAVATGATGFPSASQRIANRAGVLARAYAAHPERFVGGLPQPPARPTAVWIHTLSMVSA